MSQVSPYMATPTDQPYVRVDMKSDISRVLPTDRTAFITIPQMKRLTAKVETERERLFETGTSPATSKGMYVPISFSRVERVLIHPMLAKKDSAVPHARSNVCKSIVCIAPSPYSILVIAQ